MPNLLARLNLPPDRPEARSVEHVEIPEGEEGTRATLDIMVALTRRYGANPHVIDAARALVGDEAAKDFYAEARRIHEFVRDNIRYTQDPFGLEQVNTPLETLYEQKGDCDDMALLAGALMAAVGHPVRYVAIGEDEPNVYTHVYLETKIGENWIASDPSENVSFGWKPRTFVARMQRNV
jgi:transglutaminase-like putative cysteine protease